MIASLAVFAGCWWAWYAFQWPPSGANRLGVALTVAAVVSAALSGPLFYMAGRVRPVVPVRADQAAPVPAPPAGTVVVGEIPREPAAFVARRTLDRLAAAAGAGRVAVLCAVTGLRGVGKTQVAAAYARDRVAQGWGLVGWINAEKRDVLLAGLARVADAVGAADPEGDSLESARRLREHLETRPGRTLLVFDDAADPDGLRPLLPATGSTQIVVTSTDRAFGGMGASVDVSVFTRPESLGYLAERTGLADQPGADVLAVELGDLPLGLAQAAATIGGAVSGRRLTYQEYLEQLSRVPVEEVLGRVPGDDYPRSTAAALLLSIQTVEDADASGLTSLVLRVVAALSPAGVRRDFLGGLQRPEDERRVGAAVDRCARGSLLTWSVAGDVVIMHRLVGRVLRERDLAAGRWGGTVTAALDLLEPLVFDESQAWQRREEGAELSAQVEALWEADAAAGGSADRALTTRLLGARSWAVRHLSAAADLSRAISAGTRTLADSERLLGPDHPDTLAPRNNLGNAYRSAGRLGEAIPLFEQNLTDYERVLGPDHPDTLASRANLAVVYASAGRLGEAIPLFEQNLTDYERVLGPDHPDTRTARNNLATVYASAGRLGEATQMLEQNLADRERLFGPDHPDTLASRINLAAAYQAAGRLGEAIPLFEQNLAESQRLFGPDHPDTLRARNNLATAYALAGRLGEAIPLFEQSLADRERFLGPDHPDTQASRNSLANAYRSAGRLGEGIPLYEENLAESQRLLGPDHPDTLRSQGNLAGAYEEAGRLGEAIPLYEESLADRERVLGPDHPDTLASRINLAAAYQAAGRLGEAIPLFEQNLAESQRLFGPDHPDTLRARNNLATAYAEAGRLGEAIPMLEQNLAESQRLLGPDHPDTLGTRNNLATAYGLAGQLGEAIRLLEQNLAESQRLIGPDHPDTLKSRNNLAGAYESAGRLGEAIPLFEQNLAESQRLLGPDHPDTLPARNSLATAHASAGGLGEASPSP